MLARLDGILLGRQAEGVVAHWVQHVEAAEPLVAGKNVRGDVAQGMADVQSRARRVREHVQDIELGLVLVDHRLEGAVGDPARLPFAFNLFEIVIHGVYLLFFFFSRRNST